MNLKDLAVNLINRNPKIVNNPQAREYLNVIQSGDEQRGQQLAKNLCESMGVKPEEAYSQARNFFHI